MAKAEPAYEIQAFNKHKKVESRVLGGHKNDEITACQKTHQIDENVGQMQKLDHTDNF
jgi:hypothetical protein